MRKVQATYCRNQPEPSMWQVLACTMQQRASRAPNPNKTYQADSCSPSNVGAMSSHFGRTAFSWHGFICCVNSTQEPAACGVPWRAGLRRGCCRHRRYACLDIQIGVAMSHARQAEETATMRPVAAPPSTSKQQHRSECTNCCPDSKSCTPFHGLGRELIVHGENRWSCA